MSIQFNQSPWFILLYVALAAGAAYWMYQKVELTPNLKRFLMGLRFTSLFLLLFLLLEPLFTAILEEKFPPMVVFLQDGSESMRANKDSVFLKQQYPKLYKQFEDKINNGVVKFQPVLFGARNDRFPGIDSVRYNLTGTNIADAIEKVTEKYANQNLGAIVLVSDGIPTAGKNPLYAIDNLPSPIFTALAGDTAEPRDLLIESTIYNEISYLNTETPIKVNVKALGVNSQSITVTLSHGGKVLGTQSVNLSDSRNTGSVEFYVKLTEPGIQAYEITINEIPNEISYQNNRQRFYIRVLETRLKIALFAGAPHPDIGAFYKCFAKDNRYEFVDFIRKNESEFYRSPESYNMKDFDVFLFHNFPSVVNDRLILDKIYAEVGSRNAPILHVVGGGTQFNIHPDQFKYMAVTPEKPSKTTSESFLYLMPTYQNHSTYRFPDERALSHWIETAPPLLRNDSEWIPRGGAKVFGKAKIKGIALDYPMFAIQENGGQKNVVFLGENLWRYRMHSYLETQSFDLFDEWMYNLVQWLTTKEDKRKFKVYPIKTLFTGDEKIIFKGQVYDDNYNPVSGAEVKLTINNPNNTRTDLFLTEAQQGAYQLELANLAEGAYSYSATGTKNGQQLGTDKGEFSIGKSAIEFVQLKADENMMRQLALRTKGSFVRAANLPALADSVLKLDTLKPIVDYKKSTQSLNRFWWPILLILTLLSVEWVFRKRNGLI